MSETLRWRIPKGGQTQFTMANDGVFAMASAIPLRDDHDGPTLRRLAKASNDANRTRRLLALAMIYDGGRRG